MEKHLKQSFILLLFITVVTGCKKEQGNTPPSDGSAFFVSATAAGSLTKEDLQAWAAANGYGNYASQIKYTTDFYKVIYKTTYKGNTINASGLLAVPQNTPAAAPLLSLQHGTMFKKSSAPSNFPAVFSVFNLFASAGFITIIPDYIGYGESSNIVHPYYDQQHSGTTVADMLKAVKYYLQKEKKAMANKLFLLGYSEGGYVTMAAQKEIETHPQHNLSLTAVAAGAGGYDISGMLSSVATTSTYPDPSYLAFVIQSYNTTYGWNRPYTDFFKEPYASKIPTLLNGTKSQSEINAELTTSTAALFNPVFYANLQSAAGEPVLKQAVQNNSFFNWVPKSPTRLYHGTADNSVFYETTVSTVNRFKAGGATNVELITIPNGTHGSSSEPMFINALIWFQSLN